MIHKILLHSLFGCVVDTNKRADKDVMLMGLTGGVLISPLSHGFEG